MRSGLASWFGLGNSNAGPSTSSPSVFERLGLWKTPRSEMGKIDSKKRKLSPDYRRHEKKKIMRSMEVDSEPSESGSSVTSRRSATLRKPVVDDLREKKKNKSDSVKSPRSLLKPEENPFSYLTEEKRNCLLGQLRIQKNTARGNGNSSHFEMYSRLLELLLSAPCSVQAEPVVIKKTTEPLPKRRLSSSTCVVESPKKISRSMALSQDNAEDQVFCLICEESDDSLIQCGVCELRFHPVCIEMKMPLGYPVSNWRCFDCLTCTECNGYIDDCKNVQCTKCGKAYHGTCMPEDSVSVFPFYCWYCDDCLHNIQKKLKWAPNFDINTDKKKRKTSPKKLTDSNKIIENRGLSTPLPSPKPRNAVVPRVNPSRRALADENHRNQSLIRLNRKLDQHMFEVALKESDFVDEKIRQISDKLTEQEFGKLVKRNGVITGRVQKYQRLWPTQEYMDRLGSKTTPKSSPKQDTKSKSKSPSKSPQKKTPELPPSKTSKTRKTSNLKVEAPTNQEMRDYLTNFTFPEIVDGYLDIKPQAQLIKQKEKRILKSWIESLEFDDEVVQYLHFGTKELVPVEKCIPSTDSDINQAKLVFVCHKCFTLFLSGYSFNIHLKICDFTYPPGHEIYREKITLPEGTQKTVSFFEIGGEETFGYSRKFCTVASALLPSKAVTQEVELFTFYILTEFSENSGHIPVGFFSKELKPYQNNNLSCLLVFNQYRQSGYGKLLVDLSYALSRRERKYGSPEHPLSDDGLILYRSYWKSALYQYIRKNRESKKMSFEDMSNSTNIFIDDIVSTLLINGMIRQMDDGKTVIDCTKGWFSDIRVLRRRVVDMEKLEWEPSCAMDEDHTDDYMCPSSDDEA